MEENESNLSTKAALATEVHSRWRQEKVVKDTKKGGPY